MVSVSHYELSVIPERHLTGKMHALKTQEGNRMHSHRPKVMCIRDNSQPGSVMPHHHSIKGHLS